MFGSKDDRSSSTAEDGAHRRGIKDCCWAWRVVDNSEDDSTESRPSIPGDLERNQASVMSNLEVALEADQRRVRQEESNSALVQLLISPKMRLPDCVVQQKIREQLEIHSGVSPGHVAIRLF